MLESSIMRKCLLRASKLGWRLFRAQVGLSWVGTEIPAPTAYGPHAIILLNARTLKTGTKGMSDLIGWRTITITPDMVGKKFALYTAREIKTYRGQLTQEQTNFLATVGLAGGDAKVCRDPAEL